MKFDDIIAELGEFGPYQKRVYVLMCLAPMCASVQVLAGVFIQATPSHRCSLPGLPNDTWSSQGAWHDALVNSSIPWDSEKENYDQCHIRNNPGESDNGTRECSRWVYSKTPFRNTFVTQINLVCDDKSLVTFASMILMCGMLAGSFLLGLLSDIIGRKKVLVLSTFGQLCAAQGLAWVDSYSLFVSLRFIISFFGTGMMLSSFVMALELVGPSKRTLTGNAMNFFWCIGLFIETAIAYGIREWRYFQIAISTPALVALLIFIVCVPESARWLLQKGRTEEAAGFLQRVARTNRVTLSESTVKNLRNVQVEGEKSTGIWHVFTHRVLLFRSVILFFNWFVASMVYYGLSLNVGDLSGNLYLNFFLSAVVELVSYAFVLIVLDKTGRKLLQISSMIVGGVACMATMFPVIYGGEDDEWLITLLSLVGKFGASAGFAVIYLSSAELFPTRMRNSVIGLCSLCARIGGILAPYIGDLNDVIGGDLGVALPRVIFGSLSVVAGLLVLYLPETNKRELPETMEDAKTFSRSTKARNNSYNLQPVVEARQDGHDNLGFKKL